MRDINRIDITCQKLAELWKQVPDWRFMQLICNFQRGIGGDGFYLEEEDFLNYLEVFLENIR